MVDTQTKVVAVPTHKCVNADIVDGAAPETPALKKKINSPPPAVPAVISPRVTRSASQRKLKGRITLVIPPGKTRPLHPKIASTYARCCSLAVKEVVSVLSNWKGYKERPSIFSEYVGVVSVSFGTQLSSLFQCCLEI